MARTLVWLKKAADFNAGLDPSRDSIFAGLQGTREFGGIVAAVREATPPVSHSTVAFRILEGDLVPESTAYDPIVKQFYLGSTHKGKVIRCTSSGACTAFATGLGEVVGLKAHAGSLWVLSNSNRESALLHFDLASGALIRKYSVGAGHEFNDLAISAGGDVYLTDTRAATVWHLANGSANLTKVPGTFDFANGITLSPDGARLYVSTFPAGITAVDLKTGAAKPMARLANLCLAAIDGLYYCRGSLIAIQNGFMTPRVVRLTLSRDLRAIARFQVLERRNPLFEGITTGAIVGDDFFYMANIQDGKKADFKPITILKIHL